MSLPSHRRARAGWRIGAALLAAALIAANAVPSGAGNPAMRECKQACGSEQRLCKAEARVGRIAAVQTCRDDWVLARDACGNRGCRRGARREKRLCLRAAKASHRVARRACLQERRSCRRCCKQGGSITECLPPPTTTTTTLPRPPGGYPPAVSLVGTPEAGVAPLDVALAATASDPDGDPLVYTWDFGDGTVREGNADETYRYAAAGTYRVVVTVSDGRESGRDGVLIDVGSSGASTEVGPAGGQLELGRFRLTVPAGLLSQAAELGVIELPSQAGAAAADLDPARFRPIGPAYRMTTGFFAQDSLRLTLTYVTQELPPGFAAADLGVLLRLEPNAEAPAEPATVLFTPSRAAVDEAAHTVSLDLHAATTVQVVAMAVPLAGDAGLAHAMSRRPLTAEGATAAQVDAPIFGVQFVDTPADPAALRADALAALELAAAKFLPLGFRVPPSTFVFVQRLQGVPSQGKVDAGFPLVILIDPGAYPVGASGHAFSSLLFHEYFHVIQFWNSNPASVNDYNRWFFEGSAEWAADEVGDEFPLAYDAPTGERFHDPLHLPVGLGDPRAYQAVVFWKWFEEKGGSILALLDHHRSLTQYAVGGLLLSRSQPARLLASLQALYPEIDVLAFAKSALYRKDFDENETQPGDLWDPQHLGPPKEVPAFFQDPNLVVRLSSANDANNPFPIQHTLRPHLTADAVVIRSEDADRVAGTLHLDFGQPIGMDVDVVVIPRCGPEQTVRGLQTMPNGASVAVPFGPRDEVVVVAAATRLAEPIGRGTFVTRVWVDAAGTGGAVYDVPCCSIDDVRNALYAADPGDTVLLAPGRYTAPGMRWTDEDTGLQDFPASLVVWAGVNLEGRRDATGALPQVTLTGDDAGLLALGGNALRDLSVRIASSQGIVAMGAHSLSLCNVELRGLIGGGYDLLAGLDFVVTDNTPATLDIVDSRIYCAIGCVGSFVPGIRIRGYAAGPPGPVSATIRSSSVKGWWAGLEYYVGEDEPPVTLDVDCSGFTENTYNVAMWDGEWVDQCPAPASTTTTTSTTSSTTGTTSTTTSSTTSSTSSTTTSTTSSTTSTTSTTTSSTTSSTSSTTGSTSTTVPTTSTTATTTSTSLGTATTSTSSTMSTTSTTVPTTSTSSTTFTTTTSTTSSTTSTTLVSGCFQDAGDGTIHDTCTGLQWEKKTSAAGLHNVNNRYSWAGCCGTCTGSNLCQPNAAAAAACGAGADGGTGGCSECTSGTCNVDPYGIGAITTVWDWVTQVNAANFAGQNDWRLAVETGRNTCPTCSPRELETILLGVYPCGTSPCVDPIFGPTAASGYWSSTSYASIQTTAWGVDFNSGFVGADGKSNANYVRAVRGGS